MVKRYIVIGLAACLLVGCLTGCAGSMGKEPDAPELLEPVDVKMDIATVKYGTICDSSRYDAEVVPHVEELSFPVAGRVEEVSINLGDYVEEGQILATMDTADREERLESLKAQIRDVRTLGDFDERQYSLDIRICKEELAILQESGASAERCEAKETDLQLLESQLAKNRELRELKLAELNRQVAALQEELNQMTLVAPYSGQIVYADENLWTGYSIEAGQPVISIADNERLTLAANRIPYRELDFATEIYANIQGKRYEITYTPYTPEEYLAVVRAASISSYIQPKSNFTFVTDGESVESGQFGKVIVIQATAEHVLTIPVNALFQGDDGYYVYKIVDGERVHCDVTVGLMAGGSAEIKSGLKEGDGVYVRQ